MRDFDGLAIITVNYASSSLIESNLAPLLNSVPGAIGVIVDNYSTQDERDKILRQAAGRWLTVLPPNNVGFGIGMNLGVAAARARGATHFLLLNPDATIASDQVQTLFHHSLETPLALLAPRIERPDGSVWFAGADLYLDDGRVRSLARRIDDSAIQEWLTGACLLVSTALWDLAGGFSDDYFLYWEDIDLSRRVLAAGGVLRLCPDSIAVHAEGGTQGEGHTKAGGEKSGLYYRYNIRNRMVFAALHLSTTRLIQWRRLIVPVAWEVLMQGGRRQLIRSPLPLISMMWGIRDAYSVANKEIRRRARAPRASPPSLGMSAGLPRE